MCVAASLFRDVKNLRKQQAEGLPGDIVKHIAFYIDAELDKACNLHVA
jgi:hypothetical protein